jgi:hypothetical protein
VNTHLLEMILVGGLGVAAGIVGAATIVVTLEALRAKLRARTYFHDARLRDKDLQRILVALEHAESMSAQDVEASIAALEARLGAFSARDRGFIKQGLHQPSQQGVRRFAKELATAA